MKLDIYRNLLKAAHPSPRPSEGLSKLAEHIRVMTAKALDHVLRPESIHCGAQAWVRARLMPSANAPRRTGIYGVPVLFDPDLPANCAELRNYLGTPIMQVTVG